MAKAIWKDVILAESDRCVIVEGNHYFPPESVHFEYLKPSDLHTECPWKGTASYHHIEINGGSQQRCGLVLPAAAGRSPADQGLRRLLERCPHRVLAVAKRTVK